MKLKSGLGDSADTLPFNKFTDFFFSWQILARNFFMNENSKQENEWGQIKNPDSEWPVKPWLVKARTAPVVAKCKEARLRDPE